MTRVRTVLLSIFLSLIFVQQIDAQDLRAVKIKLVQSDSTPVSGATALVFRNDSILIKTFISNTDGVLEMENLPSTSLLVKVTRVGYTELVFNIPIFIPSKAKVEIDLIQTMEVKTAALKEVVVQAKNQ